MNRMEMFMELKKDPTKMFRLGNYEYFVENDVLKIRQIGYKTSDQITTLFFEDNREYYEVKKPFKDRVKVGDWYFYFSPRLIPVKTTWVNFDFDREVLKNGNCFETKELNFANQDIKRLTRDRQDKPLIKKLIEENQDIRFNARKSSIEKWFGEDIPHIK